MSDVGADTARFYLRKALELEARGAVASHRWASEGERWRELAFALLTNTCSLEQPSIRALVEVMDHLDLLDVAALSDLSGDGHGDVTAVPHGAHMIELMTEFGITEAEAVRSVTALADMARGATVHFDGLPQRYLRHYGELMLDELSKWFSCRSIDDATLRMTFTYWLQNAVGMPLSLNDEEVLAFCDTFDVTTIDLVTAADEMQLNLALVDDVASAYMTARRAPAEADDTVATT